MEKAIVITPTTLSNVDELIENIQSVCNQSVQTDQLLVVDGVENFDQDKLNVIQKSITNTILCTVIPFNTGKEGFYGHRVMAAFSHLHNYAYTLYLDQDNWFEKNHVESLIDLIEVKDLNFSYSRRRIVDKNGKFICNDECESIGLTPIYNDLRNGHLVDTSSYCFKTNFLIKVSQLWHKGWGADRKFFETMMNMPSQKNKFCSTELYTLNYRLGGNENSVKPEFFIKGNKIMRTKE